MYKYNLIVANRDTLRSVFFIILLGMRNLNVLSYLWSRRVVIKGITVYDKPLQWHKTGVNLFKRCMSSSKLCLDNDLQSEVGDVLEKFGETTTKKRPFAGSSLAMFADKSPVLQKLINLGVEIYRFDRDVKFCQFLLNLDFEKHIRPYLEFLLKEGVPNDSLGKFLSSNPYILQCELDDLNVRINYLQSKKFTKEMRAKIITGNPMWLSFEVKTIDGRLGNLQKLLKLSGNYVRTIALKYPKIVNIRRDNLELNVLMFKNQLSFGASEIKSILLKEPRLLKTDCNDILRTFYYLQDHMSVPVHLIKEEPSVLLCRAHILSARHKFLLKLGRAQYNPKLPGYVSLESLIRTNDENFCKDIAFTTVDMFYDFQKTL